MLCYSVPTMYCLRCLRSGIVVVARMSPHRFVVVEEIAEVGCVRRRIMFSDSLSMDSFQPGGVHLFRCEPDASNWRPLEALYRCGAFAGLSSDIG